MKVDYFQAYTNYVELGLSPECIEDAAKLVHLGMGNTELRVHVTCDGKSVRAHLSGHRRHRAQRSSQIKHS